MAAAKISISTFIIYCFLVFGKSTYSAQYLGKFLGKLSELHHGVSGEVYAVDGRTLHIKDFTYDGQGPAAYFWAGNTRAVSPQGFRIRDENGKPDVLRRYRKEGVTITLPEGKTLNNIKWFSVWCEEFEVNFGDVKIPRSFDYPRPQKIDALRGVHGISSENIVIVDAQTLLIPSLSYDGEAPDAKFWAGRGSKPSPQGIRIPDENGKEQPLRRYDRKTIVLTLPSDLTIFDIGHFGIWCEAFTVDFGHIQIPQILNVPPSLKMLGVSPQSKLNCEVLYDNLAFEVRWAVAGDRIVLQLVSKLEDREYMSFGISGDDRKNKMIGGDVAVAWIDENMKGHAVDYYLKDKSQCSGGAGVCPDEKILANTNSVRVLNAATVNGYSIVTYERPLKASDVLDRPILTNDTQAIIWAIGPLNERNEASFHSHYSKRNTLFNFGRPAKWNCPMPEGEQPTMKRMQITTLSTTTLLEVQDHTEIPSQSPSRSRNDDRRRVKNRGSETQNEKTEDNNGLERNRISNRNVATPAPVRKQNAWLIPPIECNEPEDGVFYAQMGPTGGKQGYEAITGHVGWGISWYINGLLIPEINLVRGKTYTFVVEGGFNKEIPAKYHPFYITDDPIGGYEYKTAEERKNVRIFAGARKHTEGTVEPIGVGRLCHWTHQGDSDADDFTSFGAYQRTLELKCDPGEPGVIQWTPDRNTPDTVYYQCFTHRYLGWKINILDQCDLTADGSEIIPAYANPNNGALSSINSDVDDMETSASVHVDTRLKINNIASDIEKISQQNSVTKINATQNKLFPQYLHNFKQHAVFKSKPTTLFFHEYPTIAPFYIDLPNSDYNVDATRTVNPTVKLVTYQENNNKGGQLIKKPRPFPTNKNNQLIYKRPHYNTYVKGPPLHRPIITNLNYQLKGEKPWLKNTQNNQHNIFVLKPPTVLKKPMHVEISPQQASTERDPDMQTSTPDLPEAVNTGFHPDSIVIEGGFRPIIQKEIEHRISNEDGPEVEYEGLIGMIETGESKNRKQSDNLQPVSFSVIGYNKTTTNKINKRRANPRSSVPSSLHTRLDEDEIPEAAERIESYYLPPDNRKPIQRERPKQPSNIDIPPGTVVTYDGKKVSGASLTIRINDRGSASNIRSSKATELIKTSPQFAPFKGELPPLEPVINPDAPQLNLHGVLNRNLDTPDLPPNNPTRLQPVKSGKSVLSRNVRATIVESDLSSKV